MSQPEAQPRTILIIEDDPSMLRGLRDNFDFANYRVLTASDGEKGLKLALTGKADLIVLDVMLPEMNGYEICRFLRQEGLETPILMLTAKTQEEDVVLGLRTGADDYMAKPFSIRELLARAEALMRRNKRSRLTSYQFGSFLLDLDAHTLLQDGAELKLSPKEFELLTFFAENPGKALSRDQIMNAVWGYDTAVTLRSIDRFVTVLRSKIEPDPQNPTHIVTIREFGYKFNPSTE